MAIRLSERDLRVIVKCAVSKGLTTGQFLRLFFRDVTPDAARKSLRRLVGTGYLVSFRDNPMVEALYTLGPKGRALLVPNGFDVELIRTPPQQQEHLLGINDIRVAVEAEPARVAFFFAAWEMARLGWRESIIPDALWGVKCREKRVNAAIEYDRGTETLDTVVRKLRTYSDRETRPAISATLVITDTAQRLNGIRRNIAQPIRISVLGAELAEVRSAGIYGQIFRDLCGCDQKLRSVCEAEQREP